MFKKKNTSTTPGLDEAIALAFVELKKYDPISEEYTKIVDMIDSLYKMKPEPPSNSVSKDGLVAVGGNLVGIGLILGYERLNVITSKALGFVGKAKI